MKKLTKNEKITLDAYDSCAESWADVHDDANFWAKEIKSFKSFLPDGKVLEIGVGSGRDASYFITDASYKYLGTDVSANLLSLASKRNPKGQFKLLSIYDLGQLGEFYDGFWCTAVLIHIPKSRLSEALTALNKSMREGAIGLISTKLGAGESLDMWKINPSKSRLIVYYSKEELVKELKESGFKVIWDNVLKEKHNVWQSLIVKKVKNVL